MWQDDPRSKHRSLTKSTSQSTNNSTNKSTAKSTTKNTTTSAAKFATNSKSLAAPGASLKRTRPPPYVGHGVVAEVAPAPPSLGIEPETS